MKANLKINEITRAVKLCVNALDTKDPNRSNIKFEAEGVLLNLSASNSSYSISVSCPCEIKEEGVAIVDGKMAYSVIAKGTNDCSISSDDRNMIIKTIGRTKLPNIEHDIPMVGASRGKSITFDSIAFKNAVNTISYAVSEDQSRIVLTGAHVVTDGQKATLTALDGFRLSQITIPCEGDAVDIIVPLRVILAVCDAITDGNMVVTTSGNGISFDGEKFNINAILLAGDYIDTDRLIPKSFATTALVKTVDIKNCADSATVASGTSNMVRFSVADDNIAITSNSSNADFHGDVSAFVEGDGLDIAFNLKYILQTMSHITTEECEFKFNTSVSPVIIVPHGDDVEALNLILPVRTFN